MRYSVIVPVYNVEKYVRQCIESVISQDYKDLELILVDDGSPDNSGKICDEYAEKEKRIKVIHKQNGGVNSARKEGAKNATGDYIVCLDGDDFIGSGYFSTLSGYVDKYDPDVLVTGYEHVDENGEKRDSPLLNGVFYGEMTGENLEKLKQGFGYDKNLKGANYGCLPYSLWLKAVRHDIFLSAQNKVGDNVKYGEDMLVTKYILDDERTQKIYVSDYKGYFYRQNPASAVNTVNVDSLSKYEITLTEMEKAFSGEENKVYVYAYRVIVGTLSKTAKLSKNKKEFESTVTGSYKNEKIWEYALKCKIYKPTLKDAIKKALIKGKRIKTAYSLFK